MNCPSRTDEPEGTGMNQSPNSLSAALTTREDLNGKVNSRVLRRNAGEIEHVPKDEIEDFREANKEPPSEDKDLASQTSEIQKAVPTNVSECSGVGGRGSSHETRILVNARSVVKKFGHFVGPGMMVNIYLEIHLERRLTVPEDCRRLY